MDILEQISSPSEVVKNLEVVLPKLIKNKCLEDISSLEFLFVTDSGFTQHVFPKCNDHTLLEKDCCSSYFLQIITTLLKDVPAELEIDIIEERLLCQVLPCISKLFSQSLSTVSDSLESTQENEDEVSIILSQYLQACLDILSGYNYILEYVTCQNKDIKLEYIGSLHKTLPNMLLLAFTHCKDSEGNYGSYFVICTDILTTLFRKSYEVYLKYFKALEEKLYFNCSFEEDITLLNEVLDITVTITEIVTGLDIKTAAEQWKSYLKVNNKYTEKLRDRLNLMRPLSLLFSNMRHIINTVTTDKDVLDDKSRTRLLKLASFVLKIFIKLCELYKGFIDDCLSQILDVLLLLYSCSKNSENDILINQELDTYICIGGAALLNQFFEDKHFFRELHKLYIRHKELSDNHIGLYILLLVSVKKLVVSQSKAIHEICADYPLLEMIITLYNDVGLKIDMNFLLEGNDLYTSTVSIIMALILSTVSASRYIKTERLLFENLFSLNSHTSILVSDVICLIARFTNESVCFEMVQYLSETLLSWPVGLSTHRPEYIIASATLIRLSRLLTEKSCIVISDKYCSNYASNVSYLLARGFSKMKNVPTVAVPDISTLKEDYIVFVNKLKICGLKRSVEDKNDINKLLKLLIASFNIIIKEHNTSEFGCSWNQFLLRHLLRIMPIYLPCLNNAQIIQFLTGINDVVIHGNTNIRVASAHCLRNSAKNKLEIKSGTKDVFLKIADIYTALLTDQDPLIRQESLESYTYFVSNEDHEEIITLVLNQDENIEEFLTLFQQKKLKVQPEQRQLVFNKQRFYHKCLKKIQLVDDISYPPSKKLKHNTEDDFLQKSFCSIAKELKLVKDYIKSYEFPEYSKALLKEIANDIDEIKGTVFNDEMFEDFG